MASRPDAPVLVQLAGEFTVLRYGAPLAGAELGSRKARILLTLLAVERPRLVPCTRIVEVLWPESPPSRATENIATLVSRLRSALGTSAIEGGRDGYRLGPRPAVQVDLDLAADLVEEGATRREAGEPGLALLAGLRALDRLAPGVALEDEPAGWAEPAREHLEAVLRRARQLVAHAALAAGDLPRAVDIAGQLLANDPYDEDAGRVLMRAQVGQGRSGQALATYEGLRHLLADELGADPSAPTQALHESVLRGEPLSSTIPEAVPSPPARSLRQQAHGGGRVLVGRTRELAELRDRWTGAVSGRSTLVLLVGEAGIGKTSLSDQVVELAGETGGTVLTSRCHETERSLFLQPIVEAIGVACRTLPPDLVTAAAGDASPILATLVPDAAAILGDPPPARRMTVDSERRRAFEAVTGFLRRLGERSPVLLVLDDLHIAGRATIELLHYVATHASTSSLMILATVRREEGSELLDLLADVAVTIDVGELSADAVDELAARAGHADLSAEILQRTHGHPLFVVETLRGLVAGGSGIPTSLQDAVLARVRRLGRPTEDLLRAGSVLGASFEPAMAARLLDEPLPYVLGLGEIALTARLLVPSGRDYEFANDLVREVIYATTPEPSRVVHHLHAADLLTDHPEAVAAHASAAQDWPRAARAYLLAGEQALLRYAADDAVALLSRCLDVTDRTGDLEVRGRALLARARARGSLASWAPAIEDLEEVASLARRVGDRRLEMLALRALGGEAPAALGRPQEQALVYVHQGLRIATSLGDRGMEADLLAWLAILASNGLRFDDAVEYSGRAVVAARASGDDEALAAALDGRKTAFAYLGEIAELTPVLEELEPLLRRLDDPFRLHWTMFEAGFPAVAAGDWTQAAACFERALEEADRTGFRAYEPWYVAHLGWLARLQGRYDDALELGRRAMDLNVGHPHAWVGAATAAQLGTTLWETGAREEAIDVLNRGRTMAEEQGSASYVLRCLGPLAEATGSARVLGEADAIFSRMSTPPGAAWMGGDGAYLSVARAWLDHGEPERCRTVLAPMLDVAARVPWVAPLAAGSLVDGRAALALGSRQEARALFSRAATIAGRHELHPVDVAAGAELRNLL